jgi:hypothetical protein
MDKITRIKRLVESSLNTSFGDELSINEVVILPTQKFDEKVNEWVPDSHTIFLSIKRKTPPQVQDFFNEERHGNFVDSREVTRFLEGVLGFECCVDFV